MSDDNGTVDKKKKATQDEKEERIKYAQDLILKGYDQSEIAEKIKAEFDLKKTQAYEYYKLADERFSGNCSVNLLNKLNISLQRRQLYLKVAMMMGDIELAHKIQCAMDEFLGLDIIAPHLALQSDFIQYFQEELIRILNRNNNIVDKEERLSKTIQDISSATQSIAEKVSLIGESGETAEQDQGEGGAAEPEDEYFNIF